MIQGYCIFCEIVTKLSFFANSVDKATCTTTAKEEGIRSFKNFNLLYIIEWSVVLNIISYTINKKVCGGFYPSK